MPALSAYAQQRKIAHFLQPIDRQAAILEIGCGSGWVGTYLRDNGWQGYTGIDIVPPADIVGDIRDWQELGLAAASYDVVLAFEVVEHIDIYTEIAALLKPGGRLMVTTPVPHFDWVMRGLEMAGLNQKRTSPHSQLHYLADTAGLELTEYRRVAGLSQWGIFTKPQQA